MNNLHIKKALLAFHFKQEFEIVNHQIQAHLDKCKFTFADDGSEAIQKITNDPPQLVIIANNLPVQSGIKVTEWLLNDFNKPIAVIICGETPDHDHFIDQVVTGQVQFFSDINNSEAVAKCLEKANHFLAPSNKNEIFSTLRINPGEVLLKQGAAADSVFIVKSGRLEAVSETDHGQVVLGEVDSGEFVGEMAYINGTPRNATVRAITGCELIEIPITIMDKVLFQKPAWSKALMKTLTKRLTTSNNKKAS